MPEVTVIIAAHDAGRTIDAALQSVFAQTFHDYEVIVVDDGSTDDTAVRCQEFGGRVRYYRQPLSGLAHAWNAGVRLAGGRLLMLLDPAHLWMPRKLDRQVRYFAAHPNTGLLHGDAINSASPVAALLESRDTVPVDVLDATPERARGTNDGKTVAIARSTVAVRREALEAVGPFDVSLPAADFEQELYSRVAARFPVDHLAIPVAVIRSRVDTARSAGTRSLLQDTCFRRLRSRLASTAHMCDEAMARKSGRPLRILFEAASPMSLAVFGPAFRQLARDPRLEFWFTSSDRTWGPRSIFGPAGLSERVVEASSVRWAKFDGYINTDFWDMTWLRRRTRRVHFFHGVAGKYGLDAPVRIAPVVATFDRLLFPNRDRLRRYAEAGLIDPDSPQAALIGYPKVDCLVDGSLDRSATLGRLGLSSSRPTVLYAPTWSPYSSLNTIGQDVIAALGTLGVNLIVKLHDRSYDADPRGSGGIDWAGHLRAVCERSGAHLVQEPDASPLLHAADVLVTDHSSVGFEFMLLDRPIVVLDQPELITKARVNPDKVSMLRRAAFVTASAEDVAATVRRAFDSPHAHGAERRAIATDLFYCPGTATHRAVQCIYDLLALPLLNTAGAPAAATTVPTFAPLARSL
jgi:glycosyltransferase involved in cell wall biosynthesis